MKEEKKILVLCDSDEIYVSRLAEYLVDKEDFPFSLWYYTTTYELLDFLRDNTIDVLVISEGIFKELDYEKRAGTVLVISNYPEPVKENRDGITRVCRYQSTEELLRTIYLYSNTSPPVHPTVINRLSGSLIGFYSPIGRCLQTTLALTYGQLLARKSRVLYLGFEACHPYLRQDSELSYNLSDFLCLYHNSAEHFAERFQNMLQHLNQMDYIAPVNAHMDIISITGEDWTRFLQSIMELALYDYLILDLKTEVQGLHEILFSCDSIYCIGTEDALSVQKLKQYDEMLHYLGEDRLRERITRLTLPQYKKLPLRAEELPYSEIATEAMKLCKEDGNDQI